MLNKENLILESEKKYHNQVQSLVKKLLSTSSRIVLLAGPSGSGKTTTAKMIVSEIKKNGKKAVYLSMDDWFKTKADYEVPKTEDGKLDFESPICVDIDLLNQNLRDLLNGVEINLPKYDFLGQRMFFDGTKLKLDNNTIVVIEGLHALNPFIDIDRKNVFRVFVKPEDIQLGNITFTHKDLRLYRRISRDKLHRGRTIEDTLEMLSSVSRGETLYLEPYIYDIDSRVNSYIGYELYLHKSVLGNFSKLEYVKSIDISVKDIPKTSLLCEFYM